MTSKDAAIIFTEIQNIFPSFAIKFLMSDEAMAFWNGFCSVFLELENMTYHFLCRYHVMQSWIFKIKGVVLVGNWCLDTNFMLRNFSKP